MKEQNHSTRHCKERTRRSNPAPLWIAAPAARARNDALLWAVIFTLLFFIAAPAWAITDPAERLGDPVQEARARELTRGIRCVVCQNQSIDDSNAEIAKDMRKLVREKVAAGETDQAIMAYLESRYGDFILLSPPVRAGTALLWFGPAALLVVAGVSFIPYMRRKKR